jgi:hypothetical protein
VEPLDERTIVEDFAKFEKIFRSCNGIFEDQDLADFNSYLKGLHSAYQPNAVPLLKLLRDTEKYSLKFIIATLFQSFISINRSKPPRIFSIWFIPIRNKKYAQRT